MEKSKLNCCLLLNHSTYQQKEVRIIGVEPTWIAPPDPKSGAATITPLPHNEGAKLRKQFIIKNIVKKYFKLCRSRLFRHRIFR